MAFFSSINDKFINHFSAKHPHGSKAEMLALWRKERILALNGDKMAQYRLAQMYPKNSASYLRWMQASADQGCTNAMLALSISFAENKKAEGLRQAAPYLIKILASNDSYISTEAKTFLASNPLLNAEVMRQMNTGSFGKSAFGLFAPETKSPVNEETKVEHSQNTP